MLAFMSYGRVFFFFFVPLKVLKLALNMMPWLLALFSPFKNGVISYWLTFNLKYLVIRICIGFAFVFPASLIRILTYPCGTKLPL